MSNQTGEGLFSQSGRSVNAFSVRFPFCARNFLHRSLAKNFRLLNSQKRPMVTPPQFLPQPRPRLMTTLTRILRASAVPFILPALMIYSLYERRQINQVMAMDWLERLSAFISEEEYSMAVLLIKEKS